MEKLDNTGLGLIGASIERVKNEKSLFGSALKKLVNSTEEELTEYLQAVSVIKKLKKSKEIIPLQFISALGKRMVLKALTGERMLYQAKDTFIEISSPLSDLRKPGIATGKTSVLVFENHDYSSFEDLFWSLPGTLGDKVFTQDQIIEFCRNKKLWLKFGSYTYFLCKMDWDKIIDHRYLSLNLFVAAVYRTNNGLSVSSVSLSSSSERNCHFVVPEITPFD